MHFISSCNIKNIYTIQDILHQLMAKTNYIFFYLVGLPKILYFCGFHQISGIIRYIYIYIVYLHSNFII